MVENLLKISLAVQMSRQKLEGKARRDIKYYYGSFNGTVVERSKKMILEKGNTRPEDSSQDELAPVGTQTEDSQGNNSALLYIFPVRLFEGNKVLSVIFSVAINLGLGVLISINMSMVEVFRYGQYFQLLSGLLLLPMLPAVSKEEFLNTMVLSSLWKYALYGLFISVVCFSSGTAILTQSCFPPFPFPATRS